MILLPGFKDGVFIARPTFMLLQIETQFDFWLSPEFQTMITISIFTFLLLQKSVSWYVK